MYTLQQMMQRKTINLTGGTASAVSAFLTDGTPERSALEDLAGESLTSESDVLRALVTLGTRAARDHQLESGYAAWAAEWSDEDEAWSAASIDSASSRWQRDS